MRLLIHNTATTTPNTIVVTRAAKNPDIRTVPVMVAITSFLLTFGLSLRAGIVLTCFLLFALAANLLQEISDFLIWTTPSLVVGPAWTADAALVPSRIGSGENEMEVAPSFRGPRDEPQRCKQGVRTLARWDHDLSPPVVGLIPPSTPSGVRSPHAARQLTSEWTAAANSSPTTYCGVDVRLDATDANFQFRGHRQHDHDKRHSLQSRRRPLPGTTQFVHRAGRLRGRLVWSLRSRDRNLAPTTACGPET